MTDSERLKREVERIKRLRDDAQRRGMLQLLLCYQEWLLRAMITELNEIAPWMMKRSE